MSTSIQSSSPIIPALDAAPLSVRAFVHAHELTEHLASAIQLAEVAFPAGSTLSLRVEEDPESEGKWVVMDWGVRATVDEAVGAYRRFIDEWTALAPPWVGGLLRVTFYLT